MWSGAGDGGMGNCRPDNKKALCQYVEVLTGLIIDT